MRKPGSVKRFDFRRRSKCPKSCTEELHGGAARRRCDPSGRNRTAQRANRLAVPALRSTMRPDMAAKKGKAKKSAEEQVAEALVTARAALVENGVATAKQLGSPAIRAKVQEQLQREGFEATAKLVRVPLATQTAQLLSQGERIPVSRLHQRLAGCTKKETTALVPLLVSSKVAVQVLRGKELVLVAPTDPLTDAATIAAAKKQFKNFVGELKKVEKWLADASKKKVGVLSEDWAEALGALPLPELHTSSAPETRQSSQEIAPSTDDPWHHLKGILVALSDEDTGLASVPAVVRRLREEGPEVDAAQALLTAHRRGLVELRPEGGFGRLSPEDAALCPKGAGESPLSWVRLVEGAAS